MSIDPADFDNATSSSASSMKCRCSKSENINTGLCSPINNGSHNAHRENLADLRGSDSEGIL